MQNNDNGKKWLVFPAWVRKKGEDAKNIQIYSPCKNFVCNECIKFNSVVMHFFSIYILFQHKKNRERERKTFMWSCDGSVYSLQKDFELTWKTNWKMCRIFFHRNVIYHQQQYGYHPIISSHPFLRLLIFFSRPCAHAHSFFYVLLHISRLLLASSRIGTRRHSFISNILFHPHQLNTTQFTFKCVRIAKCFRFFRYFFFYFHLWLLILSWIYSVFFFSWLPSGSHYYYLPARDKSTFWGGVSGQEIDRKRKVLIFPPKCQEMFEVYCY